MPPFNRFFQSVALFVLLSFMFDGGELKRTHSTRPPRSSPTQPKSVFVFLVVVMATLTTSAASAQGADTTPPVTTINPITASAPGPVTIDGQSTDDTSVDRTMVLLQNAGTGDHWNGTQWTPGWSSFQANGTNNWSYTINLPAGTYIVAAWAWDTSGNPAAFDREDFTIGVNDNVLPTLSFDPIGALTTGPATFTGTSNDNIAVNRNRMLIRNSSNQYWDGASWGVAWSWFPISGTNVWSYTINLPADDYVIAAWAWDDAGNMSDFAREFFTVDRKNFVVFLSDDQPAETLWAMPILQQKLADRGVTFTTAVATNPECCPFRASALSGGYQPHNTGVLTNGWLNGAVFNFDESQAMPVQLQNAGYQTGFVGRYMHGYETGTVPPGWDSWVANERGAYSTYSQLNNVTFYDVNTQNPPAVQSVVNQYGTDFHRDQALDFLSETGSDPFFLWVGLFAPHSPFEPAPEDVGLFDNYVYPLTASHTEDLSDKPAWVQSLAQSYQANSNYVQYSTEYAPRKQAEMLQSVDRAVGAIIDQLEVMGELDDTVVIYTSDNGLTYGDHGIPANKGIPYERSLKVPMVVSWPGAEGRVDDSIVASNLDIGATLFDLAGVAYGGDGTSLVPLLDDPQTSWRDRIFIENFGFMEWETDDSPIWAGVRTETHKYVLHSSGEQEMYDLVADPEELDSLHGDPAMSGLMSQLETETRAQMGVSIVEHVAPDGSLSTPYSFSPNTFGGQAPFSWSVTLGSLPPGLSLDPTTGSITGTPTTAGSHQFILQVEGGRILTYTNEPETFNRLLTVTVT